MESMHWNRTHFYIFDAPTRYSESYEARMDFLKSNIFILLCYITTQYIPLSSMFSVVNPIKVTSLSQVKEHLNSLPSNAEGLLFRKPNSQYLEHNSFFKLMVR